MKKTVSYGRENSKEQFFTHAVSFRSSLSEITLGNRYPRFVSFHIDVGNARCSFLEIPAGASLP